jgi:leucyl-tRNA synthetase
MSKSLGNGVDPDEMIEAFGADATRLFVLFAAPVDKRIALVGNGNRRRRAFPATRLDDVYRWRERLAAQTEGAMQAEACAPSSATPPARYAVRHIRQSRAVTDDFDKLDLNTNVAALMELSNALGGIQHRTG